MRPPPRTFVLVVLSSLFVVLAGSRPSTVRSAPAAAPPDAPHMSRVTTGDRVAFALSGAHTARGGHRQDIQRIGTGQQNDAKGTNHIGPQVSDAIKAHARDTMEATKRSNR